MIDNFTPQPYPLECSTDGTAWSLVIGWRDIASRITPVVADSLTTAPDPTNLRYRLAGARPVAPSRAAKAPNRS